MGQATEGRRRADAERSIAAIVAAATGLFAGDADASMTDVAKAAGVGRVTLYAHFSSREDLLRRVLADAIAQSMAAIAAAEPETGPPGEAFARLVRTCWPMLSRFGRLHQAARRALPAGEVRRLHDSPMEHVERLIERGRADGEFRTDLPVGWLVATVYALLHTAADDVAGGRLAAEDAGGYLESTLLSVLRPAP
ncbi:TetR/AcrR family transcriptional regulator [Actinomadura macrotermitis]|uniref:HTH tetR-type domain-containing protein n=1 Tax=Actinomadura macrotermitis TaxID=2585200 RepID=A0A7K0BR76_9ACTN|nr:TetR/AcrR family transcriptional regulator [Actinomadura macrotermitis]MQY03693.1 hypothetical protein [Actinomadura macrotermitis]